MGKYIQETFTFKSYYGTYRNCFFQIGRYQNKNLAIEIWSNTEGPITKVTVNTGGPIPDDMIPIKNYSENEGMVDWLVKEGYIEETPVRIIKSGKVEIPVHKLTDKGMMATITEI